jgi:glycyl-tRNA synthetase beta subunit
VAELARALHAHAGPERDALRDAYRRCKNILGEQAAGELDEARFGSAEQGLSNSLEAARRTITDIGRPFPDRLQAALAVGAALSSFFEDVLVMDPDPALRANRLALLQRVLDVLGSLGDFDQLPG